MVREELISSADPSVASAPIDKRISFLQSKNLTQEEVDVALARAGEDSSVAAAAAPSPSGYQSAPQQAIYRPPPPPPQGYGYTPYGQWQPPPEPPKRDWRDWFIMATVMGGVSYGLYFVAKRYITPLIAPPTPPQIEQDKQNIDEQFSRAFALIEQLSTDTAALKTAEEARTEKLDTTLRDVETLLADLKTASRRRDDDTRRINDEINSLKDAIPKALEGAREGNENRLRDLGTELKSLKVLLGNRIGGGASSSPVTAKVPETTTPSASEPTASTTPATNGTTPAPSQPETTPASSGAAQTAQTLSTNPANPLSRFSKSPSIPAWQLAAANRSNTASPSTPASTGDQSTTDQPHSNSPSRARSRSPTRPSGHSRHHRHRDDPDRHPHHKHSKHSHSRRDRHSDRDRPSKHATTTEPPAAITLPFNTRQLVKRDLEVFKPMFAMYLDIQKGLIFEDMGEEEVKGRWKSYVRKWNRGELAEGWYDPATLEKARQSAAAGPGPGPRESPDYGRRGPQAERQRDLRPSSGDIGEGEEDDDDDDDDEYGPMPSYELISRNAGPAIPTMQDLDLKKETAIEDTLAERHSARQTHRAEITSHKSTLRHMQDEVAPRAEPGTHERRMEKRREAASANRDFAASRRGGSPTDGAPEDELMGSGENELDAIKSARTQEQRKKNEREIRREEILRARTAEREERVRQYREKEDETIGWLKTLAKQRFG
ncbi:peroxisomal membrane anchor protein conserved region-domain-containing protein [Aspergillus cavernicola]|uniref:Peroxisomal membrane protein PEX14 n=1 Tax=Aspergillus cavernicola TaxID=176166 RepID=A0ABR4IGX7_9EURO